ncbi:MAG: hypothetical protein EXR51_07365 [Dehalococcoidia bacterium]|nr:hypothetical protein [Dehalococcoidia bacterium]
MYTDHSAPPVDRLPPSSNLPAAESHVLLHWLEALDAEPFRLALMELAGRNHLGLVQAEEPGMRGMGQHGVLVPGEEPGRPEPASLAALWDLYYSPGVQIGRRRTFAGGVTGVALRDFTRAAVDRFGSLVGYTRQVVVPALVQQGLLEPRTSRRFLIIRTRSVVLTAAGEAKQAELSATLRLAGRPAPERAANDPVLAMQHSMLVGSALLMIPDTYWDRATVDQTRDDWSAANAGTGDHHGWGGDGGGWGGGVGDGGGGSIGSGD